VCVTSIPLVFRIKKVFAVAGNVATVCVFATFAGDVALILAE